MTTVGADDPQQTDCGYVTECHNQGPSCCSLHTPGTSLHKPGTSLHKPGTSLYTPGTSLQTPGTSLHTPGTSLHTPGTALHKPGTSLHTPGTCLHKPGTIMISDPHYTTGPHLMDPGQTAEKHVSEGYKSKQSLVLGICHMVCGFLFIVFNSIAIHVDAWGAICAHGIIAGLLFIVTGCFGVVASGRPTNCKVGAFLVLSIVSAVMTAVTLGISSAGWSYDSHKHRSSKCPWYHFAGQYICSDDYYVALAMNAMMVFLSLAEAMVAIWSAAICCAVKCCGRKKTMTNATQQPYVVATTGGNVTQQPYIVATTRSNVTQQPYIVATNGHNVTQQPYVVATTGHNATQQPYVVATTGHNAKQQQCVSATTGQNEMQARYVVAATPQNVMPPQYVSATTCSCGAGAVNPQPKHDHIVQNRGDECGSSPLNTTEQADNIELPPAYLS